VLFKRCPVPAVLPEVRVLSNGMSSVRVEWDSLSPQEARGAIAIHRLIYQRRGSDDQHTVDIPADVYEYVIDGMTVFRFLFARR